MTWATIECNRWFRILLTVVTVIILTVVVDRGLDRIVLDTRHPIESWGETHALNQPTIRGNKTRVRSYRNKVRLCPVEARRFAVRADGVLLDIPDMVWEGGSTEEYVDLVYDTSKLEVGEYILRVDLTYHCGNGVFGAHQPDAKFSVVAE